MLDQVVVKEGAVLHHPCLMWDTVCVPRAHADSEQHYSWAHRHFSVAQRCWAVILAQVSKHYRVSQQHTILPSQGILSQSSNCSIRCNSCSELSGGQQATRVRKASGSSFMKSTFNLMYFFWSCGLQHLLAVPLSWDFILHQRTHPGVSTHLSFALCQPCKIRHRADQHKLLQIPLLAMRSWQCCVALLSYT